MSVWRLLVVSHQRFCEDKAELWVTVTEGPNPALSLGSILCIGDFFFFYLLVGQSDKRPARMKHTLSVAYTRIQELIS